MEEFLENKKIYYELLCKKFKNDLKINVLAKPNSSKSELIFDTEKNLAIIYLKSVQTKNKANLELIKFFKKNFNLKVKILKGEKTKRKLIEIIN